MDPKNVLSLFIVCAEWYEAGGSKTQVVRRQSHACHTLLSRVFVWGEDIHILSEPRGHYVGSCLRN